MSRYPKLPTLDVTAWPSTDRKLWQSALSEGDRFRSGGLLSEWKPSTVARVKHIYGNYLWFLTERDLLKPDRRPSERLTERCLRPYMDANLVRMTPQGLGKKLCNISMAVRAMEPNSDRTLINQVVAWMDRNKTPTSIKQGKIVSPVRLLQAGIKWMDEAEAKAKGSDKYSAADYRDGLAVALMALCPIRVGPFSALRLNETLANTSDGIRLQIPEDEMKTRKPLDVLFPSELLRYLHTYLKTFRPRIHTNASRSRHLWINFKGEPITDALMRWSFYKVTEAEVGTRISPHRFRDAAATHIYDEMPERALLAASVLQHSDFQTTEKHYINGEQRNAALKYHEAIKQLVNDVTHGTKHHG